MIPCHHINQLAVMRLDGDMYVSTVDVLYNLYDKLSIGGYMIMDDWFGFPSRMACVKISSKCMPSARDCEDRFDFDVLAEDRAD